MHRLEVMILELGWPLLAALAATCLASIWLLIAGLRRSPLRRALAATLVTVTLTAALAAARVEGGWSEIAKLTLAERSVRDYKDALRLAAALARLFRTLSCTPAVLLAAMLAVAVALLRERRPSVTRGVAVMAALLVALSAAFASRAFDRFRHGFGCARDCQYEELTHSIAELRSGQIAVTAAAALLCLASLLWFRREVWLAAPPQLGRISSALLVLGLIAFVATRSLRWDASHPLPLTAPNVGECVVNQTLEASLPVAPPDCLALEGPAVELLPDAALVDGTRLTQPDEVTEVLRNKAKLWREINPGQPLPGTIVVLAPTQASTTELRSWLAAAQRAGFSSLAVYMRTPSVPLLSKTLGTLHQQRCCARPVALADSAATPLTHFKTWGDLALATRGAALAVSLH